MEIPNYKKTVLHYFAFRYLFVFPLSQFPQILLKTVVMQCSQFDDFSTVAWLRVELSSSTVELVSCRVLQMTWFRAEPSSSTEVLVPRGLLQRKWFRVELSSSPEELQRWRLWCSSGDGSVGHGAACFTICSIVVCFKKKKLYFH